MTLEEESIYLKNTMELSEKQFGDMTNDIQSQNAKLQEIFFILQMENAKCIGIQSKHNSILTFKECDVQFKNDLELKEHILKKHQVERFKYSMSGLHCKTSKGFKLHVETVTKRILIVLKAIKATKQKFT